jgi:hypothetical protein
MEMKLTDVCPARGVLPFTTRYILKMLNVILRSHSWREMLEANGLLMYWVGKGQNAALVSPKMEDCFSVSVTLFSQGYEMASGAQERRRHSEQNEYSGRSEDPLTSLKVVDFLNSNTFAIVCQIATASKIPQSTIFDRLRGWRHTIRYLK